MQILTVFTLFVILGVGTYLLWKGTKLLFKQEVENPRFGGGECAICLIQPKYLQISATCGHTFCGKCVLDLHKRNNQKIDCPLCRKPITTLFRLYRIDPEDQNNTKISNQIYEYNHKYDDNRSLWRVIKQLPYTFLRIRTYLFDPNFILFIFKSGPFIKWTTIFIIYLLCPYDIFPEQLLGAIGFLDDVLIGILIYSLVIAILGIIWIRKRNIK